MWLLETATLKLHYFISPEAVEEGYLILSHLWDTREQSFQDLQKIHNKCAESGQDPRELVSPKIRGCCEVADRHGYKWAWIDTCCIDKTSSAELSEAINSMFRYYTLALVCYVFLRDMPSADPKELKGADGEPRAAANKEFANHRWHRRGWTLQELIAPRVVHFLSGNWEFLGSKADLADGLEVIAGIPATILRQQENPSDMSVAQRMSWAANRQTTRIEDEAYCLLGIFDVNMPTLYGEGQKAFQRLQEEIMKRTPDTTLFAWGHSCHIEDLNEHQEDAMTGLFAARPSDFRKGMAVKFAAPSYDLPDEDEEPPEEWPQEEEDLSDSDSIGDVMSFSITPHGVLARIPIIELDEQTFGDLSWYEGDFRLLLILRRRPSKSNATLPLYDIGLCNPSLDPDIPSPTPRVIRVPKEADGGLARQLNLTTAVWHDLYLALESVSETETVLYIPTNHDFPPFIRFPERLFGEFLSKHRAENVVVKNPVLPWYGIPPATISFAVHHPRYGSLHATLQFGRCFLGKLLYKNRRSPPGPIWLKLLASGSNEVGGDDSHQCPLDHMVNWPGLYKQFEVITGADGETPGPGRRAAKWVLRMKFSQSIYAPDLLTLDAISLRVRYATQEDLQPRVIPRQNPVLAVASRILSVLFAAASTVVGDVTTEPTLQAGLRSMVLLDPRTDTHPHDTYFHSYFPFSTYATPFGPFYGPQPIQWSLGC